MARQTEFSAPPFPSYLERLRRLHGTQGMDVRHEVYFTAYSRSGRRAPALQIVRALGALLRDSYLLWLKPGPRATLRSVGPILLVATLPGTNGWRTVAGALPELPRGAPTQAICHPRLGKTPRDGVEMKWLPRPRFRAVSAALRAAVPHILKHDREINCIAVAAAVARRVLWSDAWERLLGGTSTTLIVHNDFDMMSAAGLPHCERAYCLQHGVPTEEFFPVRADFHVVWGESSRTAYLENGVDPASLIVDPLGRKSHGSAAASPDSPPAGIALISQGHNSVYGEEVAERLRGFAAQIAALLPGRVMILLHPQEADRHAYKGIAGARLSRAPHFLLTPNQAEPWLVVGFSSTALIDADLAGHYVVGITWQAARSRAAQSVASPPQGTASPEQLFSLFESLTRSEPQRRALLAAQDAWRARTFAPVGGGLAVALGTVGPC